MRSFISGSELRTVTILTRSAPEPHRRPAAQQTTGRALPRRPPARARPPESYFEISARDARRDNCETDQCPEGPSQRVRSASAGGGRPQLTLSDYKYLYMGCIYSSCGRLRQSIRHVPIRCGCLCRNISCGCLYRRIRYTCAVSGFIVPCAIQNICTYIRCG